MLVDQSGTLHTQCFQQERFRLGLLALVPQQRRQADHGPERAWMLVAKSGTLHAQCLQTERLRLG